VADGNKEDTDISVYFATDDSLPEICYKYGPKTVDTIEGGFSFALYDQNSTALG